MAVDRHPVRDELLIGGADGVPKIYRMYREKKRVIGDDYNLIRALGALNGRIYDTAFSPDGSLVASVSSHATGGELHLAKADDGVNLWSRTLPSGLYTVDFDPSGKTLAAAGFDGAIRVFDTNDGVLRRSFDVAPLEEPTSR